MLIPLTRTPIPTPSSSPTPDPFRALSQNVVTTNSNSVRCTRGTMFLLWSACEVNVLQGLNHGFHAVFTKEKALNIPPAPSLGECTVGSVGSLIQQ